jgi:hypothetical protein
VIECTTSNVTTFQGDANLPDRIYAGEKCMHDRGWAKQR